MADQILKALEAERNKLWAEARLKGLAKGTPERDRIAEMDARIHEHKEASRAKGLRGEKRPADAIGRAVIIGKIATGEIEDERDEKLSSAAAEMGRKGGRKRAESMTPERRAEIARKAAAKRWGMKA